MALVTYFIDSLLMSESPTMPDRFVGSETNCSTLALEPFV